MGQKLEHFDYQNLVLNGSHLCDSAFCMAQIDAPVHTLEWLRELEYIIIVIIIIITNPCAYFTVPGTGISTVRNLRGRVVTVTSSSGKRTRSL